MFRCYLNKRIYIFIYHKTKPVMKIKILLFTVIQLNIHLSCSDAQTVDFSILLGDQAGGQHSITIDKEGFIYSAGTTNDPAFPVTQDAYCKIYNGDADAFITKLSPDGKEIIYSTFIGGSGREHHCGITVDDSGNVYIVGGTQSKDFPVTQNAFDTTFNGEGEWGGDVYVLKLSTDGSKLLYSTYVGGRQSETAFNIAVDKQGFAYIQGSTSSSDFPTTEGSFNQTLNGVQDAFIAKINQSGSELIYSTFIGGRDIEVAQSIEIDNVGNAYITGMTNSVDFPVTCKNITPDGQDAFVLKLNSTGDNLLFSNRIGGESFDIGSDIAIDPSGNIFITGYTQSANFPCSNNALDTTYNGKGNERYDWYGDVFLTKVNSESGQIEYSTFLGGSKGDAGIGISCPEDNIVYISGNTYSQDFPTSENALNKLSNGKQDMFLTVLDLKKNEIIQSTYIGGSENDQTWSKLQADSKRNVFLMGYTSSIDFPYTFEHIDSKMDKKDNYYIIKLKQ